MNSGAGLMCGWIIREPPFRLEPGQGVAFLTILGAAKPFSKYLPRLGHFESPGAGASLTTAGFGAASVKTDRSLLVCDPCDLSE